MLESTKDLNKVIMAVGRNVAKIEGLFLMHFLKSEDIS